MASSLTGTGGVDGVLVRNTGDGAGHPHSSGTSPSTLSICPEWSTTGSAGLHQKSGNPNGNGLPNWPAFTENTQQVMYIDGTVAAKPVPNIAQLQALNDYYSWRRAEAQKR